MKKPLSPILVRLFIALLFIAAFSASYLLLSDTKTAPSTDKSSPSIIEKNYIEPQPPSQTSSNTILSVIKNKITPTITASTTTTAETGNEQIGFTLKTPGYIYPLKTKPETTLLNAMRQLTAQSAQPFLFNGREYPSLGFFVEEINGLKNDAKKGDYWIYYINNQPAQVGISNYLVKQNDLIEWKYEKSKF